MFRVFTKFVALYAILSLNSFADNDSTTALPINISPTEVDSPYFQSLKHKSSVFDYVNYEIAQDSNGFIWFAGYGGLARFDGYELKEFKHSSSDKNSIAEDAIRSISADNKGGLWLSLYNLGLSYYNGDTQQFRHFPHDKNNANSPPSNTIRDIIVLDNNDLWIGSKNGLSYFNQKTASFTHFTSGTDIKNDNYILDMTIDKQGVLWLSTATGLKIFDKSTKQLITPNLVDKNNQPLAKQKKTKLFRKLITAQDGKIWLAGFHENIHVLDPNTRVFFPLPPRESGGKFNHMSINQVSRDEIWVSNLTTGIEVFDADTMEKIQHHSASNKKSYLLKRNNVDVIFTDKSGNIWLSFNGEVPQFYNQNLSAYQYIAFNRSVKGQGVLRNIPLNDKQSVLSIFKNLAIFDEKKGLLKPLDFPNSAELSNSTWEVAELASGKNNEVWLGLTIPALIKFDLETQQERYYSFEELGVRGNVTYDLNYISEQEVIISTSGGAIRFNPSTEKFTAIKTVQGQDITARMWRSFKSESGDYFLSSNEGLFYQLNGQQGFRLIPVGTASFKGSSVEMVAKGKKNEIWVLTNKSIYQAQIINEQIKLTEVLLPKQPMIIDRIAITVDNDGLIWLGPYSYFHPYENKYVNLSHYNIFNNNAYNSLISSGNFIYASSDNELLIIDKEKLTPLSHQAEIQLTELSSGSNPLKIPYLNETIVIPASSQELNAKFSALDYAHAEQLSYQYKLQGLDDYWRKTTAVERRAIYTSLPSGEFTLEIKANHKHGNFEHKTLAIPITVLPKFYQTWWFRSLTLGLAIILLWLLHKAFLKKAMQREQELNSHQVALERAEMMEELITKKNQLLADVSHELSTPLTVLKLQVESLKDDLEEDVQITYNALDNKLDDIQHLIDDIHQLAQSDVGALKLKITSFELNDTLNLWQQELTQFVNKNKLSFEIEQNIPEHLIVKLDKDRLKQIFSNLITNSIKYTDKPGQVKLSSSIEDNTLFLSIEDSAPGVSEQDLSSIFERLYRVESSRSRQTGGSGLGLAICKSLIEGHNGTIQAQHSSLGGLKIVIQLPITS